MILYNVVLPEFLFFKNLLHPLVLGRWRMLFAIVERALTGRFAYQPRQDVLSGYDNAILMQQLEALLSEYC